MFQRRSKEKGKKIGKFRTNFFFEEEEKSTATEYKVKFRLPFSHLPIFLTHKHRHHLYDRINERKI